MTVSPLSPSSDVTEEIARLIWMLCQTVTERCSRRVHALTGAQADYIVTWLLAARTRFRGVVARIRAGRPPKPRARKPAPRPVKPKPEPEPPPDMSTGFRPPPGWRRWAREDRAAARRAAKEKAALERAAAAARPQPLWRTLRQHLRGWLCGCAPAIPEFPSSAAAHANTLRGLLTTPEMRALLLSHPSVGESLRRVCWSLGIERSLLFLAPTAAAEPAAAAPACSDPAPAERVPATSLAAAPSGEIHVPGPAVAPRRPDADGVVPTCGVWPPAGGQDGFFKTG